MKSILKYSFIGLLALAFSACTSDFEKINTNPYEATDDMLEADNLTVGSFFSQMIVRMIPFVAGGAQDDSYGSTGSYQHFQGLCSDWYSGYVAPTGTWKGGNHNAVYSFEGNWGNSMYQQNYTQIMPTWRTICINAAKKDSPQEAALATIVKVLAMHRVTDQFGPIPYVNYTTETISNQFDSQEAVYKKFFEELDESIEVLAPYAAAGATILGSFDKIYQGNVDKWVRLANTLRLRLALRIVYVNPSLAKSEGEKALSSSVGFLSDASDRATISGIGILNPLWEQAYSWNEERMNASMDAYLNGYDDPRRAAWFTTCADGKYHGVRLGVVTNTNTDYIGDNISNFNLTSSSTLVYFSAAESYFLRAEAALRGWNAGGTAKDFYEQGIRVSFAEQGVNGGVDAYIASTNEPAAFVDNTGKGGDAAKPSSITVAYDESASFEQNLERIITQKWIANFLISPEGWAEYRRTGYPKLFPTTRNLSGNIDINKQIRRMPYPQDLYDNNRAGVQQAIGLLGGADNGATKLWWDKNPNH